MVVADHRLGRYPRVIMARLRRRLRLAAGSPGGRRLGALARILALCLATGYLGFLAAVTPHLVHHAFDEDEGGDCAFLAVASHAPVVGATPVLALPLPVVAWRDTPVRPREGSRVAPATPPGRGPPRPLLATA